MILNEKSLIEWNYDHLFNIALNVQPELNWVNVNRLIMLP